MRYDYKYSHNGREYGMLLIEQSTAIQVFKDGIKTYLIKKDWCTCDGYKYRRKCTHYSQATESGFINRIKEAVEKSVTSNAIENMRRHSVEEFGKKNKWGKGMVEWALVNMDKYVKANKDVKDMVRDYNKTKKGR